MTLYVGWNWVKKLTPQGLLVITLVAEDVIWHEFITCSTKLKQRQTFSVNNIFIVCIETHPFTFLLLCSLIQRINWRTTKFIRNKSLLRLWTRIYQVKSSPKGSNDKTVHSMSNCNYCSPILLTREGNGGMSLVFHWSFSWNKDVIDFYCAFLIVQAEVVDCMWSSVKAWLSEMVLP